MENGGIQQTCQLVSLGSPEICIRYGVRRGRGAVRSWAPPKPSRWREPRANWTVKRSPIKSDPSCRHISQDTTDRFRNQGERWPGTVHDVRKARAQNGLVLKFSSFAADTAVVYEALTWNDISGVHCILVLDEPKTVHELDLGYLASAMGSKMRLDVLLTDYWGQFSTKQAGIKRGRADCWVQQRAFRLARDW